MKHKFKITIEGEVEDTWESDEHGTVVDDEAHLINYIKEQIDLDDLIDPTIKIEILK